MSKAVYPGSFDPVTVGHLDIIKRAAGIFDEVTVLIMENIAKRGMFDYAQRRELMEMAVAEIPNVRVDVSRGLLTDYLERAGANTIVKGLRGGKDLDYETEMAYINRTIMPSCDTVFLVSDPLHTMVSSTNVRELINYGVSLKGFVPESIRSKINEMVRENRNEGS